jgi:hypothetical protein
MWRMRTSVVYRTNTGDVSLLFNCRLDFFVLISSIEELNKYNSTANETLPKIPTGDPQLSQC